MSIYDNNIKIIGKSKDIIKMINNFKFYKEFSKRNETINNLKNKHINERCFIIGTGPSLNKTNLNLIHDEILYGVNTLFRGLKEFCIECKYWTVTDPLVLIEHYKDLLKLNTTLFIGGFAAINYLKNKKIYDQYNKNNPILFRSLGLMDNWNKFGKDLLKGSYLSNTVMINCLQIAYF